VRLKALAFASVLVTARMAAINREFNDSSFLALTGIALLPERG
jgi:hypothetical protein